MLFDNLLILNATFFLTCSKHPFKFFSCEWTLLLIKVFCKISRETIEIESTETAKYNIVVPVSTDIIPNHLTVNYSCKMFESFDAICNACISPFSTQTSMLAHFATAMICSFIMFKSLVMV